MDDTQQTVMLDKIAERIRRLGVPGVVGAVLQGMRPLAFIGGQLLWVAQPALSPWVDRDQLAAYAWLLEQPDSIDLLQTRLQRDPTG